MGADRLQKLPQADRAEPLQTARIEPARIALELPGEFSGKTDAGLLPGGDDLADVADSSGYDDTSTLKPITPEKLSSICAKKAATSPLTILVSARGSPVTSITLSTGIAATSISRQLAASNGRQLPASIKGMRMVRASRFKGEISRLKLLAASDAR